MYLNNHLYITAFEVTDYIINPKYNLFKQYIKMYNNIYKYLIWIKIIESFYGKNTYKYWAAFRNITRPR